MLCFKIFVNLDKNARMLCHEGKVSLFGFIGNTLLALSSSISILFIYDLSLDLLPKALICVGVSTLIYAVLCAICYFALNENDYEVGFDFFYEHRF